MLKVVNRRLLNCSGPIYGAFSCAGSLSLQMVSLMSERNKVQERANNTAVFVSGQKLLLLQALLSKTNNTSKSTTREKRGSKTDLLLC